MNRTAKKVIMIVAAAVFVFSSAMFFKEYRQAKSAAEFSASISEMAVTFTAKDQNHETTEKDIPDKSTTKNPEVFSDDKEKKAEESPIRVDFDLLYEQNRDVVAWLYCPDTPINYPVVQASDNDYYLHRLLDGRYNTAGSLFADCRNSADFSDWNTVIYGHNMKNNSMFGTLTDYKKQSYFEDHPVMYLLTPKQSYKVNVLAGFVTQANSEIYHTFNPNQEEKEALIESWLNMSDFDSKADIATEYNLVSFSTCSDGNSNERYVIVGVLENL